MKRHSPVSLLACLILLFAAWSTLAGCGRTGVGSTTDEGSHDQESQRLYEDGYRKGYRDGYDRGYADGKAGVNHPDPDIDVQWNPEYASGYGDGFQKGYVQGHGDAEAESVREENETEEVEAAMVAFAKSCSTPGLEFRIENIVIHGDEAAGIAVCTNEVLENVLVVVRKGPTGWYGVDFGTGIEPPSWYPYY